VTYSFNAIYITEQTAVEQSAAMFSCFSWLPLNLEHVRIMSIILMHRYDFNLITGQALNSRPTPSTEIATLCTYRAALIDAV